MSDLTNAEYFAQRAVEAWNMSEAASDPRAARAHAYMAKQYEALAKEFDGNSTGFEPQQDQFQAGA